MIRNLIKKEIDFVEIKTIVTSKIAIDFDEFLKKIGKEKTKVKRFETKIIYQKIVGTVPARIKVELILERGLYKPELFIKIFDEGRDILVTFDKNSEIISFAKPQTLWKRQNYVNQIRKNKKERKIERKAEKKYIKEQIKKDRSTKEINIKDVQIMKHLVEKLLTIQKSQE